MTGHEAATTYEDTDAKALQTGERVLEYILNGTWDKVPIELRGLRVFGVVCMMRTHPEYFDDPEASLDPSQHARFAELEASLEQSLAQNLHYYPFGHIAPGRYDTGHDRNREAKKETWEKETRQRPGKFSKPRTIYG